MLSVTSKVSQESENLDMDRKKNTFFDDDGDEDSDDDKDDFRANCDDMCDVEFATTEENYEEQGFLWICGKCESRPMFETIHELFSHKRDHTNNTITILPLQVEENISTNDGEMNDSYQSAPSPFTEDYTDEPIKQEVAPSPVSSEDIPLSNLSSKLNSLKNKKISKDEIMESKKTKKKKDGCENNFDSVKEEQPDMSEYSVDVQLDCKLKDETEQEQNVDFENVTLKDSKKRRSKDDQSTSHVCKICLLMCCSRGMLSQHKKTHLYKDTGCYRCGTCGKMCPKYDNFTRHLTIHYQNREKTHQCESCYASFYNLADMKRHQVLHLTVKPYTCEHCGEGFTRQDNLLIHAYKHTGVQYKKFACKQCDKVLNSPSALVMHVKTHSMKTVFCPEPDCKFSCYLQSQLRQHLKKHSGEKPYQCSKCGRCFARSNDMKNHIMNVHERIRPFKCPACPKEFALMGNLRIHYSVHTNERPYLCAQCGKCFNHPSTLRKHSVIMHSPWRSDHKSRPRMEPLPEVSRQCSDLQKNRTKSKITRDSKTKEAKKRVLIPPSTEVSGLQVKTEDCKEEMTDYVVQEMHEGPHQLQVPHITVHVPVQPHSGQPFVVSTVVVEQPELHNSSY